MATHPRVAATLTNLVDIHQRQAATPQQRAATPQRWAATPQQQALTPQRQRAATLLRRAATLLRRAAMLQQQVVTLLALSLPILEASLLSLVPAVIPPCLLSQVTHAEILILVQFNSNQFILSPTGPFKFTKEQCACCGSVGLLIRNVPHQTL